MKPDAFLEIACEQCGVIKSREIGVYEFFHLSFQEYLAAAHMKENGLAADLAERVTDPFWQEVVRLAVAMQGVFAPLFRALIRSGRITEAMALARDCLDETLELDSAPFVELLDAALLQMAKADARGPRVAIARPR